MTFKTLADQLSRFFVGGLFIFSGLIKLNDPVGTKIKMEEYFGVFADDFGSFFEIFVPYAMEIGMIIIVVELVLGVAVLIMYKMRITAVILLVMMIFFTFLTFYSAYFNKVTDCGCFGDAIKLTPWQSFFKDVILLFPVLHLFWYRKTYRTALPELPAHAVVGGAAILSLAVGIYAIQHLPYIDFRAYRVGNHIPTQMQPEEQPIFEYVFLRKQDGEQIRSEKYLTDTTQFKYVSVQQTNEDKTQAKITDYAVTDQEGQDVTAMTFEGAKLIFVIYNALQASDKNMDKIRSLVQQLDGNVDMMVLTASSPSEFEAFRHEHQLAIPYYFADATVLKTIVRSNPGITLWIDGTVRGMWHHNDTPDSTEILRLIRRG